MQRVFAESRPKRRRPAGWKGTLGETIQMEQLTLDYAGELDVGKILTRFAAVMQMYHRKSGLRSASHVAAVTGRTRAAAAAQRAVLVRQYYEATDGAAGFEGVKSARRLRERAKKITKTQTP